MHVTSYSWHELCLNETQSCRCLRCTKVLLVYKLEELTFMGITDSHLGTRYVVSYGLHALLYVTTMLQ